MRSGSSPFEGRAAHVHLRVTDHTVRPRTSKATAPASYFDGCFGIRPFSFSMSLMFIFMPPGIMMSPGF